MKAKKALKRLTKAETLLAGVRDQYSPAQNGLRDLLETAAASVAQARAAIDAEAALPQKKAPARAKEAKPNRLSAAGRKRISQAAKKRWAAARRLKKTA